MLFRGYVTCPACDIDIIKSISLHSRVDDIQNNVAKVFIHIEAVALHTLYHYAGRWVANVGPMRAGRR